MRSVLEVVGAVAAVAALPLAYYAVHVGRTRKTIDWAPVTNVAFLAPGVRDEHRLSDLQVTYAGHVLESPRVVVVRIQNTGNREIRGDEFTQHLKFAFPTCHIFAAEVVGESSEGVYPQGGFTRTKGDRTLEDVDVDLLNVGDWFDMQFVVDGPREYPNVTARFAGQSRPVGLRHAARYKRRRDLALAFLALALGSLAFAIVEIIRSGGADNANVWTLRLLMLAAFLIPGLTIASLMNHIGKKDTFRGLEISGRYN